MSGAGAVNLAKAVEQGCKEASNFAFLYGLKVTL